MENASKALLMAAGILIGILILSLMVYLFATFSSASQEARDRIAQDKLNEYNVQFTKYDGKEVTIYDVVNIANTATETNIYYELTSSDKSSSSYYVTVNLKRTGEGSYTEIQKDYGTPSSTDIQSIYNNYIQQDLNKINNTTGLPKYDCKVEINQKTGRVNKVSFTQK